MSENQTDAEMLVALGVDFAPAKKVERSANEQRIIAGFEEITRFTKEHGRAPQHGQGKDIFERIYAVRLDQIRDSAECRKVLEGMDAEDLLQRGESNGSLRENGNDEALLSALDVDWEKHGEISKLKYVKPRAEIRAADEVAKRDVCKDFDVFRPLFQTVQQEIASGERRTIKFKANAEVSKGDLIILDGQKIYVAEMDELFVNDYERPDRRLRVIYDNSTENDILLRSLQRALNKDKESRRITDPSFVSLFSDEEDEEVSAAAAGDSRCRAEFYRWDACEVPLRCGESEAGGDLKTNEHRNTRSTQSRLPRCAFPFRAACGWLASGVAQGASSRRAPDKPKEIAGNDLSRAGWAVAATPLLGGKICWRGGELFGQSRGR